MMRPPSLAEWSSLYGASDSFRRQAPWEWTQPDGLFALEAPRRKDVAFCSIHGADGKERGLNAFVGAEGYRGLRHLVAGEPAPESRASFRFRCVSLAFVDRPALQAEDLRVIRALGLRFRGNSAWPLFRSQAPEHLPWFLDRGEAVLLTAALKQAVNVALQTGRRRSRKKGRLILTRFFRHGQWREAWRESPPETPAEPLPASIDDLRLFRLRDRTPARDALWEVGCFTPTAHASGPPYFPTCVVAASPIRGGGGCQAHRPAAHGR